MHHLNFRLIPTLLLAMLISGSVVGGEFEVDSQAEAKAMKAKVRASQFLHRATFGPSMADIDALADRIQALGLRRACGEWIDEQLAAPEPTTPATAGTDVDIDLLTHEGLLFQMVAQDGYATTAVPDFYMQIYRWFAWWDKALRGEDQLRQRMAWALSQILVTSHDNFDGPNPGNGSTEEVGRWVGMSNYYDTLAKHSFGNYRDLLRDVTYHPCMGVYLSHMRNRKAPEDGSRSPDENYAREIMQLFSIGLYELKEDGSLKRTLSGELIPTYDNETIKSFARVFTGLTYTPSVTNNWSTFYSGNDLRFPMEMFQEEHDTDPKIVFPDSIEYRTTIDSTLPDTDPAHGNDEIEQAIDVLFNHDNVGPFISYRLIQRLVKSNPSRAYVRRVARKFNDNGQGERGDLKAVVKQILLDPEAWSSIRIRTFRNPYKVAVKTRGSEYSRLQEPVNMFAALLRGTDVTSSDARGRMMLRPQDIYWQQAPYKSPSVFNFFLPNYQPPGELIGFQPSRRIPNGSLVAPEFQQKTSVTSNYLQERYISIIANQRVSFTTEGVTTNMNLDLSDEIALIAAATDEQSRRDAISEVLDQFDLVLCSGTVPQDFKDRAVDVMIAEFSPTDTRTPEYCVENALIAIATSPFYSVAE